MSTSEVLEALRPSPQQIYMLSRAFAFIKGKLEGCLKQHNLTGEVELEGSLAKGTILSDKWEIDVFLILDGVSEEWVKERGESLVKDCLRPLPLTSKYAEHPYVTVDLMGIEVEVVPAVKGGKRLGVARTPLHTRYVREKISERPGLADEIRLLKSFMKGIGVYGAEIGGFSGYLAELLAIKYGSFEDVLRSALDWKPPVFISLGEVDEGAIFARYRGHPMIFVDPVDPARNAAAAVTLESMATFMLYAALYLERPDKSYFHIFGRRIIRPSGPAVVLTCNGTYAELPKENVIGIMRRIASTLSSILAERSFKPTWSAFWSDFDAEMVVAIGLESLRLPELEVMRGPAPWQSIRGSIDFLKRRMEEGGVVWVDESGRVFGLRDRKVKTAAEAVEREIAVIQSIAKADRCVAQECADMRLCGGMKEWTYGRLIDMM